MGAGSPNLHQALERGYLCVAGGLEWQLLLLLLLQLKRTLLLHLQPQPLHLLLQGLNHFAAAGSGQAAQAICGCRASTAAAAAVPRQPQLLLRRQHAPSRRRPSCRATIRCPAAIVAAAHKAVMQREARSNIGSRASTLVLQAACGTTAAVSATVMAVIAPATRYAAQVRIPMAVQTSPPLPTCKQSWPSGRVGSMGCSPRQHEPATLSKHVCHVVSVWCVVV